MPAMALSLRRNRHNPRLELTPLLDVIFLLLTMFMFNQLVAHQAELLNFRLPQLSTGVLAKEYDLLAVSVDSRGQIYVNREPVDEQDLQDRLSVAMNQDTPPSVYLQIEAGQGDVDRAPLMIRITQIMRQAGVDNFSFVGSPEASSSSAP